MLADLMFRRNEYDAAMYHFQQLLNSKPGQWNLAGFPLFINHNKEQLCFLMSNMRLYLDAGCGIFSVTLCVHVWRKGFMRIYMPAIKLNKFNVILSNSNSLPIKIGMNNELSDDCKCTEINWYVSLGLMMSSASFELMKPLASHATLCAEQDIKKNICFFFCLQSDNENCIFWRI